jgi:heterodisulfide reductase subunit B
MMQRGKISLVPHIARPAKHPEKRTPREDEMMIYPGCSFHGTAAEFGKSTEAVMDALGMKIVEPEGWICCGSSPGHKVDHHLAVKMPLENLAVVEKMGYEHVAVPCAACFNRFKAAVYDVRRNAELRATLDRELDYAYQDSVQIDNLVDALLDQVGLETIRNRVTKPLTGLKVVPYYGCLLTRRPEVTEAPNPENPTDMDVLLEALGAEVLDWSDKTRCCGGTHSLTRTDIAIKLSRDLIENARAVGADAIAVACPLCHANLDARQAQMDGLDQPMPVLYFTQLMAVAFGLDEKAAALRKNMVDPRPVLAALSLTR